MTENEAIAAVIAAGAEIEKLLDLAIEKRAALSNDGNADLFQEVLRQARLFVPNALDFQRCAECRDWMAVSSSEFCGGCAADHADDAPRIQ